jgi:hypothetical protein
MEKIVQVKVPVSTPSPVLLVKSDPTSMGFGKSGTTYKQD